MYGEEQQLAYIPWNYFYTMEHALVKCIYTNVF